VEGVYMQRVLLTGMSGTGKSTLVQALTALGYRAIDTDAGYSHWVKMRTGLPASPSETDGYVWDELDWVWQEDRMAELLAADDGDVLFVAGTAANQGRFYPLFDSIILLSAPVELIMERLTTRTNNTYGATPRSMAKVRQEMETIEPLLRRSAHYEVDTSQPLTQVVEEILRLVGLGQ
jgi:shikimate kinase